MKKWILSIGFNLFETICIFFIGYLIGVNIINELIILMLFAIPRFVFKGASHYKSPFKCFIVSMLLGTSFMLMFGVNPLLGYVSALFSGFLLTNKGNIANIYQWNKISKYQIIIDFIDQNPQNYTITKYEEYLLINYPLRYEIYKLRFKDKLSFEKIMDELGILDHKKVLTELNIIYETLKFALNIE